MVDTEPIRVPEQAFDGEIRPLRSEDIPQLQPIFETWMRNSWSGELQVGEVSEAMQQMRDSLDGAGGRTYLVAQAASGEVVGTIGFKKPDEIMQPFARTDNPAELINAYVSKDHRKGKGVGRALVGKLEEEVRKGEFTEIILNSGPRYKDTGWGFYDRLPSFERVGVAKDMFGVGADAQIWSKILPPAKPV